MQHTVPAVTASTTKLVVATVMIEITVQCTWSSSLSPIMLPSLLLEILIFTPPTSWPTHHTRDLSWENCYSPSYTKRYEPLRMTDVQYRVHKNSQMDPNLNLLNQLHAPTAKVSELTLQKKILLWIIRTKPAHAVPIYSVEYVKTVSYSFT